MENNNLGSDEETGSGTDDLSEAGAVLPLLAFGLGLCLVAGAVLTVLVDVVVDRARAQAAADASALAGVVGGEAEARRLAIANDADLVSFTRFSGGVRVTVRVDRARASAAAELGLSKD